MLSKAFDLVDHSILFNILLKQGGQGSVLSPYLFAVYLDNLLVDLNNSGVGCYCMGDVVLLVRLLMQMMLFY